MNLTDDIFAILATNMESIHGARGKEWIHRLPLIAATLADKWGLTNLTPVANMTFNFVAKGLQGTRAIVLKISCNPRTYADEKRALMHFNGLGMVALYAHDDSNCALLLEELRPGTSLKDMPKREAENIYAGVVIALHASLTFNQGFMDIRTRSRALDNVSGLPHGLHTLAVTLRDALLRTASTVHVIHGDLHCDNIVRGDTWRAIDPKGLIGERAFECAAFDYVEDTHLPELLAIDPKRYCQWVFVRCMLGAAWCIEDNMNPAQFLSRATKAHARL